MLLEKSLDGFGSHLIEVVRNSDFAFHKSQTTMDSNFVGIEWHNLDQRLTGFGDDKRFPRAASSTRRDKWVLASWMLTICTVRVVSKLIEVSLLLFASPRESGGADQI